MRLVSFFQISKREKSVIEFDMYAFTVHNVHEIRHRCTFFLELLEYQPNRVSYFNHIYS